MLGSPICLDASFVVRLVSGTEGDPVLSIWDRWIEEGHDFVAPVLMRYEVTNALYGYLRRGIRNAEKTLTSLRYALALPIQLDENAYAHETALNIAARFKLSAAYDAHYLVLSERLGAEFRTADRKLVNSVKHAYPWVHLIEPYP